MAAKHIEIYNHPSCMWVMEDDIFVCTHDIIESVEYAEDHLGIHGHYQTEHLGYACAECGEPLDGSPEQDREELMAEQRLMDLLGK